MRTRDMETQRGMHRIVGVRRRHIVHSRRPNGMHTQRLVCMLRHALKRQEPRVRCAHNVVRVAQRHVAHREALDVGPCDRRGFLRQSHTEEVRWRRTREAAISTPARNRMLVKVATRLA